MNVATDGTAAVHKDCRRCIFRWKSFIRDSFR